MIWCIIWAISEHTRIGLGRFAPFVFGRMIGKKGHPKRVISDVRGLRSKGNYK